VGGLVGYNVSGTIEDCCAAATVSGQNDVGGLVGDTLDGAIARCYCSGSVTGWGADIGGLIGDNFGALSDCYSIADVTATPYGLSVGGLAGENAGGWGVIENCYAAGRVTAEADSTDVGGLVGTNAGAVRHCFWDTQATGQATSAAGTGGTTAELQTLATFLEAGWDFVEESDNGTADIWYLLEHWDYPRLAWDLPADLP